MLRKIAVCPCAAVFFILLAAVTVFDVLTPDADISELENRALKQRPVFSAGTLVENRWTKEYGEYVREQFVFRNGLLRMHSFLEQSLQKLEVGDVWLGKDGYLFAKTPYEEATVQPVLRTNVSAICRFAENFPGNVYVLLVPSASNILADHLRLDPPRMDENAVLDAVYKTLDEAGVITIDVREALRRALREQAATGAQLYYRTDHHWTTDGGALIAYRAFCSAAGRVPVTPAADMMKFTDGFLGSNYAKALITGAKPDRLVYYDFPNAISIEKRASDGTVYMQEEPLMAYDKFLTNDMYGAFLNGINGYTHIDGDGDGSIVVIKDSFGNCFAPFLISNYGAIEAVDLRGRQNIGDLITPDSDVLILYSFTMFAQDVDLFRLPAA